MYGTENDGSTHAERESKRPALLPATRPALRRARRAGTATLLGGLLLLAAGCSRPVPKIGAVLPLSGPDAALGEAARDGLEASLAALGETAIELEILDSGSDAQKAAEQAAALIEGGALAVVGGVTPEESRSLAQAADAKERVAILTSASEQALSRDSKWVYRLGPSDAEAGAAFATFAAQRFKNTSAALLARDAAYAAAVRDGFESTFKSLGGEILHSFEGTVDELAAGMAEIRQSKPDFAVLAGDAAWQHQAAQALRQAGFDGVLFAGRHLAHPAVVGEAAGIDDLLFAHSGFDLSAPQHGAPDFLEAFQSQHGRAPDALTAQVAAEAWDALKVLHLALQDRTAMASEIRRGLRDKVKSYPGASGSLEFDDTGAVTSFPRVYSLTADGSLRDHGEHLDLQAQRIADQRRALQQKLQNLQAQMQGQAAGG